MSLGAIAKMARPSWIAWDSTAAMLSTPLPARPTRTNSALCFWRPRRTSILAKLRAVPAAPAPDSDYSATYRPLKAYLITTSNPDPDSTQDTVDFLPSALVTEWAGGATPNPALAHLAQTQFEFYANLLPEASSCMANAGGSPNDVVVARARFYLNGFQGFQHVYLSMIAAANHKVPALNFNSKFPGSAQYILDNYSVPGAFSKDGFSFMQDAILHPDPYFSGEEWVLGPSSGPPSTGPRFPAN